jgi:AbrB family looped-hinge helix DNA binding protein
VRLFLSSTQSKLETVRVKRKGQVTIPVKVRRRHKIEEGDLLTIETKDSRTIVMKVKKLPEPGRPVGPEEQKRILGDLEKLRKNWR